MKRAAIIFALFIGQPVVAQSAQQIGLDRIQQSQQAAAQAYATAASAIQSQSAYVPPGALQSALNAIGIGQSVAAAAFQTTAGALNVCPASMPAPVIQPMFATVAMPVIAPVTTISPVDTLPSLAIPPPAVELQQQIELLFPVPPIDLTQIMQQGASQ